MESMKTKLARIEKEVLEMQAKRTEEDARARENTDPNKVLFGSIVPLDCGRCGEITPHRYDGRAMPLEQGDYEQMPDSEKAIIDKFSNRGSYTCLGSCSTSGFVDDDPDKKYEGRHF
jgi:hypothetical protein